jgi:hypothetical protein
MISTRIKIDLGQGIVEAEGSEDFVRSVYDDFKIRLGSTHVQRPVEPPKNQVKIGASKVEIPKKKKVGRSAPSIVTDLDLSGGGKAQRLREFYSQFKPSSNFERNLIFVYYLTEKLHIAGITVDHVYTCYRDIPGLKAPNTYQSLIDTSRRHGWLDTSKTDDIKFTVKGMNYLEHDMPKSESE